MKCGRHKFRLGSSPKKLGSHISSSGVWFNFLTSRSKRLQTRWWWRSWRDTSLVGRVNKSAKLWLEQSRLEKMMMVRVFQNFDCLFLVLTTVSTKLVVSSHQAFRAINWLRKTKTALSVRRATDLYRNAGYSYEWPTIGLGLKSRVWI